MSKGKREAAGGGWHTGGDPWDEKKDRQTSNSWDAKNGGKHQQTKEKTGKKTALIVLCCIAAVILVIAGAIKAFVVPPDVSDNTSPGVKDETLRTDHDTAPEGTAPEKSEDAESAENDDARKENFYTFLLMGKDTSSGSTDTIILVSYDVTAGTVNCMSIPRDTMVNVSWDIKKINSVYSMEGGDEKGMEELKRHVSLLTGIAPDFHVIIEWKAVGRLVEALDGVWFDVPYTMDYDDDWQDLHIHQEKGYRLLDGDDAMQVVRWRGNNNDSPYGYHKDDGGIGDTGRMSVQQDFLKAVASQCLQLKNWNKISEFANIFFENVETDIKLNNLLWFAQQAMGVNMDNVSFMTVPGNPQGWAWSRTYRNNQSYFYAYPDEVVEMVNQHFNPYLRDITEDDLQIMYKNKNGSLGVTNGTLQDAKAASAPVKSSGNSGSSSGSSTGSNESGEDSGNSPGIEVVPEGEKPAVGGETGGESVETVPPAGEGEHADGELPAEPGEETPNTPGSGTGESAAPAEPDISGNGDSGEDDNQMPAWLIPG